MKRTLVFASVLALMLLPALSGHAAAGASPDSYYSYNFNGSSTVSPWRAGAAAPSFITPETLQLRYEYPPLPPAGTVPLPNGYAFLHEVGGQPVWMMAAFRSSASKVALKFEMKDFGGCYGCIPLVYVGRSAPVSLEQFTTDFSALTGAWTGHSFDITIPAPVAPVTGYPRPDPTIWVAITYTNLDLAPYSHLCGGIDNIGLRIYDEWANQ